MLAPLQLCSYPSGRNEQWKCRFGIVPYLWITFVAAATNGSNWYFEEIERFSNRSFDMVRLGLGLYGISELNKKKITPVASLTSSISQIKWIKKGESIGYGRSQKLNRDSKIGVIPIGYADGYSRILSNGKGKMFIGGKFAPTIGKVCMDMTMIDLTNVNAKTGDLVEIFGSNHTIQELAEELQTIPYEILSSISERVVKIYIEQ